MSVGLFSRKSPWPYAFSLLASPVILIGMYLGGYFNLLLPIIAFGMYPILDLCWDFDNYNPSKESAKKMSRDIRFHMITWIWVPIQLLTILVCLYNLSKFDIVNFYLTAFSLGIMTGGIGINISHELIHRNYYFEKILGICLLHMVTYSHFYIEHIWGHHKRVATRRDPATARKNESVYRFIPRSIIGGYISAWKIDIYNRKSLYMILNNFIIVPLIYICIYKYRGIDGCIFFALQGLTAVLTLEMTNYIEHYGLTRDRKDSVSIKHSWNSNTVFSNYLLFKLQRHTDHHINPGKRYPVLINITDAPQLPTGYPGSILLSLVPPLWYRIMNKKLEKIELIKND